MHGGMEAWRHGGMECMECMEAWRHGGMEACIVA